MSTVMPPLCSAARPHVPELPLQAAAYHDWAKDALSLFSESAPRNPTTTHNATNIVIGVLLSGSSDEGLHPWLQAASNTGAHVLAISDATPIAHLRQLDVIVTFAPELWAVHQNLRTAAPQALLVFAGSQCHLERTELEELGAVDVCSPVLVGPLLRWLKSSKAKAVARRHPAPSATLNLTTREIQIGNEITPLHPREVELLLILRQSFPTAISTSDVCRRLLGDTGAHKRQLLWQHLHQLRRKLGQWGGYIQRVKPSGYRCLLQLDVVNVE